MTQEQYDEFAAYQQEMQHLYAQIAKWQGVRITLSILLTTAEADPQADEKLKTWLRLTWQEAWDEYSEACSRCGEEPMKTEAGKDCKEYLLWSGTEKWNTTHTTCTPKNANKVEDSQNTTTARPRTSKETTREANNSRPKSAR